MKNSRVRATTSGLVSPLSRRFVTTSTLLGRSGRSRPSVSAWSGPKFSMSLANSAMSSNANRYAVPCDIKHAEPSLINEPSERIVIRLVSGKPPALRRTATSSPVILPALPDAKWAEPPAIAPGTSHYRRGLDHRRATQMPVEPRMRRSLFMIMPDCSSTAAPGRQGFNCFN